MLRINLLPVRQIKKRATAKKQLFGMLLLFLCVGVLLAAVGLFQVQKIDGLKTDIASLKKEKKSYAPTLAKIANYKKQIEELTRKTEIIKKLKKDSSLTVRVLDEVAKRVDNERVWLSSLQQQGSSLRLSGVALDNQTVAQFMDTLKASPYVKGVSLTNSSLKGVSGRNLKSFQLVSTVSHPKPEDTDKTKAN
jgi:type IV pilus assembly protein PilN